MGNSIRRKLQNTNNLVDSWNYSSAMSSWQCGWCFNTFLLQFGISWSHTWENQYEKIINHYRERMEQHWPIIRILIISCQKCKNGAGTATSPKHSRQWDSKNSEFDCENSSCAMSIDIGDHEFSPVHSFKHFKRRLGAQTHLWIWFISICLCLPRVCFLIILPVITKCPSSYLLMICPKNFLAIR